MLLRFGCSNYLSVRAYQELSLVASSLKDLAAQPIDIPGSSHAVLPAVAVYGANASGKTNVLLALDFLCHAIVRSHRTAGPDDGVPRNAFALDVSCKTEPSLFDADFIVDDVHFHYGFSCNDKSILEEWLYAYPKNQRQVWFHRNVKDSEQFYFGKHLRGRNKTIADLTNENTLFLTSAAQNNHKQLQKIVQFWRESFLWRISGHAGLSRRGDKYLEDSAIREKMVDFVRLADFGILDIDVRQEDPDEGQEKLWHEMNQLLSRHFGSNLPAINTGELNKRVLLSHRRNDGSTVAFEIEQESRGTASLLGLLGPVFDSLIRGRILVVDELDTTIHTMLSRKLVQLFGSPKTNPGGGQLIFSTHDTNLLSTDVLRRDQVWFTEKSPDGETCLYPLTDLKTRKQDNLEKGYLTGRYGAVPYLGRLDKRNAS